MGWLLAEGLMACLCTVCGLVSVTMRFGVGALRNMDRSRGGSLGWAYGSRVG